MKSSGNFFSEETHQVVDLSFNFPLNLFAWLFCEVLRISYSIHFMYGSDLNNCKMTSRFALAQFASCPCRWLSVCKPVLPYLFHCVPFAPLPHFDFLFMVSSESWFFSSSVVLVNK